MEHFNVMVPDDVLLDSPRDLAALSLARRQRLLGRLETIEQFADILHGSAREARRLMQYAADGSELGAVLLKCDEIDREARQIKAELNH